MSGQRRLVESELVEQLVVEEREIPHVVERAMGLGVAFAGARMVGGIHGEVARQRVMELGPPRAPSAVQKNQRRPRARDLYARLYLVIPDVDGAFLNSGHGSALFWNSPGVLAPGAGCTSRRRSSAAGGWRARITSRHAPSRDARRPDARERAFCP